MILTRFIGMGVTHVLGVVYAGEELARGWGSSIRWLPLDEAMEDSQINKKPMMAIVHKTGCPVCARVKPLFAAHKGIQQLSQYFAMVNLEPNEVPRTPQFEPDGAYVPRFLFFDSNGIILWTINGNEPKHKYFYDNMSLLESNMRNILKDYETHL